jgi:hypothetical protein
MKNLSKQFALGISALLLTIATASAQNSAAKPSATAKPQAVTTAREASSGMATGRREAAPALPAGTQSSAKNSGHATEVIEYKDGEDTTTRYRPGNNKTTAVQTTSADAAKPNGDKKDVPFPACDGASKDAAKCAAAPPAPSAQTAKRVNKVEAISIKQ